MFSQFRGMILHYSSVSQKTYNNNIEHFYKDTLVNMTKYIENHYPELHDTEWLKQAAGTGWLWATANEWSEIAKAFSFSRIYYIEKNGGGYFCLLSSDIERDYDHGQLHNQAWTGAPTAFYDEAWETKQLTVSQQPNSDRWDTLTAVAQPIISNGKVIGILGVDYDISFMSGQRRQELELEGQEKVLLERMKNIFLFSLVVIVLFVGYYLACFARDMRDIKAKGETARESENRLRVMLDTMAIACYFFDQEANPVECNQKAVDLFGCNNKEEFLERFFYLSPECQSDGRRSKDVMEKVILNAFETDSDVFNWEHIRTDETPLPVEVTLKRVKWKDGYRLIAYLRDLSKLVETEDNLRRVLAIVENLPHLVLFIGAGGHIEYMNPAVSEITGFSQEEVQKNGLTLMFSPADFEYFYKEYIATALKKRLVVFEMPIITKNGGHLDFYFSVFSVKMFDGSTGVGILGRNYTDIKRMQLDLAAAKDQAERALASEIQYNKAKNDFLSRVSHELRTPLNAIIGIINIADKNSEIGRRELDHYGNKIRGATEHLLELINDILDMTGFDTGNFIFSPRPFSFSEAIGSVIDSISLKALAKQQTFVTDIDSKIHDLVESDERRLKQILLKLLSNAVEFTPEGGKIELSAKMPENDGNECLIQFEIKDNGVGISPAVLERLGDVFEQADNSIAREHGGLGLSLSLTKRIIELMKGELRIESELGKGSHFTCSVRLGVAKAETEKKTGAADGAITGIPGFESVGLTGKQILVVDDVDINREILFALLENTGAILDEASTGDEAVRLVLRNKYDLVLMDLHMPVMDGFIATKNIRASPKSWTKTIPIISVSADSGAENLSKCVDAGINDRLTKPVEMEPLFKIIAKWIR